MKRLAHTAIAFTASFAQAADLPRLACREADVLLIDATTLSTTSYASSALYRFSGGSLYLSDATRAEYRYNAVSYEGEDLGARYTSGHKTFIFAQDLKSAQATHVSSTEIRVSKLLCTRT
jgi:hypothetical protein